jgi:hypothetical protein
VTQLVFICPDCEQPTAIAPGSLCLPCSNWRKSKFAEMDDEWQRALARRERLRMSPGARFGEALADMAKVVERSRR